VFKPKNVANLIHKWRDMVNQTKRKHAQKMTQAVVKPTTMGNLGQISNPKATKASSSPTKAHDRSITHNRSVTQNSRSVTHNSGSATHNSGSATPTKASQVHNPGVGDIPIDIYKGESQKMPTHSRLGQEASIRKTPTAKASNSLTRASKSSTKATIVHIPGVGDIPMDIFRGNPGPKVVKQKTAMSPLEHHTVMSTFSGTNESITKTASTDNTTQSGFMVGEWVRVQVLNADATFTGRYITARVTAVHANPYTEPATGHTYQQRYDLELPDGKAVTPALPFGIRHWHLRRWHVPPATQPPSKGVPSDHGTTLDSKSQSKSHLRVDSSSSAGGHRDPNSALGQKISDGDNKVDKSSGDADHHLEPDEDYMPVVWMFFAFYIFLALVVVCRRRSVRQVTHDIVHNSLEDGMLGHSEVNGCELGIKKPALPLQGHLCRDW